MIQQDNPALNMFKRFACYFIALGKIVENYTKYEFTDIEIWNVYAHCVCKGYIDSDCYLNMPAHVLSVYFSFAGHPEYNTEYIGWWNKDTGEDFWSGNKKENITDVVERYPYGSIYHFKLPDFDPSGEFLNLGSINGRRYFRITEEK